MKTSLTQKFVLSALSLSLTACATPITTAPATVPIQVTDNALAPAPAQPSAQQVAPAAPAAALTGEQASAHVTGVAAFGAEALAGYALKAFDAVTNAELALTGTPSTDAKGAFEVTVAGVATGRYVRLVGTKAGVAVETTFVVGQQDKLTLDAASTFLSQLAAGPLEVSGWASAGAADKATADYFAKVQALSPAATTMLAQQNAFAGVIVRVPAGAKELADQDAAYATTLSNLGQVQVVMTASAEIVKATAGAESAPAPAKRSVLGLPTGHSVKFRGTQLAATKGEGDKTIHLTNTVSGKTVEANDVSLVQAVSKVKRPSHSRRSAGLLTAFPLSAVAEMRGETLPVFEMVGESEISGLLTFYLSSVLSEDNVASLGQANFGSYLVSSGTPPTVSRADLDLGLGAPFGVNAETGQLVGFTVVNNAQVTTPAALTGADSYLPAGFGAFQLVFYFKGGLLSGLASGPVSEGGEFQPMFIARRRTAAVEQMILNRL